MYIKALTSTNIMVGPFQDNQTGAALTGLTITTANVFLHKAGSTAFSNKNESSNAASAGQGWYRIALDTVDTNFPGRLIVRVSAASALPVWHEYDVISSAGYDLLVEGDGIVETNTSAIASAILDATLTETYAANESEPTLTQAIYAIHQGLFAHDVTGANWTVRKLNNSSAAFTITLDDSSAPTGASREA